MISGIVAGLVSVNFNVVRLKTGWTKIKIQACAYFAPCFSSF